MNLFVVTLHGSGETLGRVRLSQADELNFWRNAQGPSNVCEAGKFLSTYCIHRFCIKPEDYVRIERFTR